LSKRRVAVVGVGSFGKNHARVYHELSRELHGEESLELVGVVDNDRARGEAVARDCHTTYFPTIEALLVNAKPEAASVAVPTVAHLAAARALMEGGVDVLIEKPISPSLKEADEIIAIATKNNRIGQVGHLERFNPAVRATLPLVTCPMFFEVHRLSVFTPRSLDVDVVLDLMIHDLDVVLAMVKSPVREIRAVGLPVLTTKVDIASARVEFENGCVANFTASRISTERIRKLRFFQPHQYVSLDFSRRDVFTLAVKPAGTMLLSMLDMLPQGENDFATPIPYNPPIDSEEPLRAELRSFMEAVRTRNAPLIPLTDGRNALDLALGITQCIQDHRKRNNIEEIVKQHPPKTPGW
jgi:predicted dehydrogenase